ncbi:trehalose-phosphatase [Streptomyces catenulae]|uniref:Trehalose 6-phosphate phosphatase n=1 Tax=Streptomyces catenulae TaxID=66875 RepID=A0ABV2Z6U0_9ACTN|nr:trehalose-phosphatase [Streptomyces catenulae]
MGSSPDAASSPGPQPGAGHPPVTGPATGHAPAAGPPPRPGLPVPRTAAGRDALAALLAAPGDAALAVDFDGTLAEIVDDPEAARAHPGAARALGRLVPRLRAAAVITGRPAAVAVRLAGVDGAPGLDRLTVLGHYGAERWEAATGALHADGPPPAVAAAEAELPDALAASGVWHGPWTAAAVEHKGGRALAVHTRRAPDPQGALDALRAPLTALATCHGLLVEPGRYVLELRPPGVDKGVALTAWLRGTGARTVVYAGDDLGDLAAFDAVDRLRSAPGTPRRTGLLVCSGSTEVPELAARADLVVDGPTGVVALLDALADRLTE